MDINQQLAAIKERNMRVEADKAWETSAFRIGTIAFITYVFSILTLTMIKVQQPWLAALIPMLGFVLSTLTLAPLKKWWLSKRT